MACSRRAVCLAPLALALACGGGGAPPAPPPDVTPPTAPGVPTAVLSQPTTIELSWSASADAGGVASYRIFRDGAFLRSVAGTTATDAGLAPATRYCYAISAVDAAGNESAQGGSACQTTGDGSSPTAPSGLAVSATRSGALDLAWSPAADDVAVTGYRVYRGGALLAAVAGTSAADETVAPATRYCYAVTAVDGAGNESAPSAEACEASLWAVATITCVPTGYSIGSPDVAVDSKGKVHVAFPGQNAALFYATDASGTWEWTLVKQGTTEAVASVHVALDPADRAHLAWYGIQDFLTPTNDLRYATNAGGSWVDETVDSAGDVGQPNAIAVGPDGQVHLSYFDATGAAVRYARGTLGSWELRTLEAGSAASAGTRRSLVRVSPAGEVHVVYGSAAPPAHALRHALLSGGTTTFSTIPSSTSIFGGWLLALDPAGRPWVAWSGGSGGLTYDTLVGTSWVHGVPGVTVAGQLLVVDAAGRLHFHGVSGYFPAGRPAALALVRYTDAPGTWTESISVIELDPDASRAALAVEPGGRVHAVYVDASGSCLRYATDR
jgi:chitodextrinase